MNSSRRASSRPSAPCSPFARDAGGEMLTMDQVRERSRRIKLARAIREERYEPNLDALAQMLSSHPDFQK